MKKKICSLALNSENKKNFNIFYNELALYNEYKNILFNIIDLSDDDNLVKISIENILINVETKLMMTRVENDLKIIIIINKEALNVFDVVDIIVETFFIILNFINHNWIEEVINAMNFIVNIAASVLIVELLNWIIKKAIIALFESKLLSTTL